MILRYPFLRRNVTEHATLLLIVSAHVLLDAATPSPVTASATFSAACSDRWGSGSTTRPGHTTSPSPTTGAIAARFPASHERRIRSAGSGPSSDGWGSGSTTSPNPAPLANPNTSHSNSSPCPFSDISGLSSNTRFTLSPRRARRQNPTPRHPIRCAHCPNPSIQQPAADTPIHGSKPGRPLAPFRRHPPHPPRHPSPLESTLTQRPQVLILNHLQKH